MAIVPAPVVTAPEPGGLRYGLFAAAAGPLELPTPHGYGGGVQYEPVSCGTATLLPIECDDTPPEQIYDTADGIVTATPFLARATYVCGPVGNTAEQMRTRVTRRLANGEQLIAEAGLADVLAGDAIPVAADDPTSMAAVVAALEQWLYGIATAAYGNVGFLHAPARVQGYAARAGLIVPDSRGVLRTHLRTIWIFGGGYPDDDTVYISGHVTVWRAAEMSVPPPEQQFDRTLNQYRLIADREYAVAYDCVAASTQFTPEVTAS